MKTIVAILALAAAASAQALQIETPISNVYSLGTLTTDTGNPDRFKEGTFTFTSPIVDFKEYRLFAGFDPDGVDTVVLMDYFTTSKTFSPGAGDGVNAGETSLEASGSLDMPRNLKSIHFYIALGGGPDAAFVNFPSTFALTQVTVLPDPNPNNVPDTGSTSALLGIGALGLATIRRKMVG